jgi:hypothetical protein
MLFTEPRARRGAARLLAALGLLACAGTAVAGNGEFATTFYVAKISGEAGWEDVMVNPAFCKYVDAYLAVAALSKEYSRHRDGRLGIEWEGQAGYAFGDQTYWEFNVVPALLRWHFLPTRGFNTSAAFGLGLSFTTDMSDIEVELEGESSRSLIYWVMELTAGPSGANWAMSLRLHHRSVGYGLLGEDGGLNALGLGMRWKF